MSDPLMTCRKHMGDIETGRGVRVRDVPGGKGKPLAIAKRLVWEAWLKVKANQGAAGVDEESIQAFEANLAGNLYKLWNRLCSGSCMPPPVKAVEIPKRSGGSRVLGLKRKAT